MIKKALFSFVVLMIFQLNVVAAVVKGKVIDSAKEPLEFVNVKITSTTNFSDVYGSISNTSGLFIVDKIPAGSYTIELSFMGYKTQTKTITIKDLNEEFRAGVFVLQEDSEILSEVEVVGQASQMRFDIDKKVFNVDQNLASSGASVSEMLQNIPSVEVDNDGNISLRNSSNVEVWINGKASGLTSDNRADILEQMSAGTIEAVEVITNPSAKFNPEGTAGIINLVLKEDRKPGYYGSVSAGTSWVPGNMPGANAGLNFNYNSSKVDFYVNFGTRYMNSNANSQTDRYTFETGSNKLDTISLLNTNTLGSNTMLGMFARAGVDIHLNKKNTLSFSGNARLHSHSSLSTVTYSQQDWDSDAPYDYSRLSDEQRNRNQYGGGIDYLYKIDTKGSEIRSSIEYFNSTHYHDNYTEQTGDASNYEQVQISDAAFQDIKFKLDYTQKFNDNMKLEAGLYGSWDNRSDPSYTWNLENNGDSTQTLYNDFIYEEWITAAYATYGAKFGAFSMSLGLRGEYTNRNIKTRDAADAAFDVYNDDYFEVYPTAFFSYAFPNDHELQANYTRRISRPRGWYVNSFRNTSDSTNISFGNPYLLPEFSSSMELNYIKTWDNHAVSASLYYRATENVIQSVQFVDTEGIMNSTYENISNSQSGGLEIVAKNKVARFLNLTTTLNGYYSAMTDIYYDTDLDGVADLLYESANSFSWSARLMANFMFTRTFSGQISGSYNSAKVVAQGTSKGQYVVDLGVRKSFLDRKLNLSFSVRDLFNSRSWATTTEGDNFWQYSENFSRGTNLSLSLSYNFGNSSKKDRRSDSSSSDSSMDMEMDMY